MSSLLPPSQRGPRACATCAKAKARCVPGLVDGICERCHRLSKPCSSQTPAPPRKRKSTPKPTRVAQLERRLEDLTARVELARQRSRSRSPPGPQGPGSHRNDGGAGGASHPAICAIERRKGPARRHPFRHIFPLDSGDATDGGDDDGQGKPAGGGDGGDTAAEASTSTTASSAARCGGTSSSLRSSGPGWIQSREESWCGNEERPRDSLWPQPDEAEVLLETYRKQMEHLFPFVLVPRDAAGAEALRRERPFLWKGVMMAACQLDGTRQIALGTELLGDIAQAAITRPQKSTDLLQGLQILIAWFHYNLNSFQMTNLLFLARSICVSMGFAESARSTRYREHTSDCFERMRAFAGCYYLVTLIFTTNKKPDALMNTSYLEACCGALERAMEFETDGLLVGLVHAQQLAQSVSLAFAFRNNGGGGGGGGGGGVQMELPLAIIVKSFQQQIEAFKASLPQHLKDNPSLTAHIHIAEILLYETGIQDHPHSHSQQQSGGCGQHRSYVPLTERLELLWSCLAAVRAFLAIRFARPVGDGPRFVCASSFDFMYCFLTCLRLATLRLPGWDLALVRRELDFDGLMERQVRDMLLVAARRKGKGKGKGKGGARVWRQEEEGEGEKEDPYERLARMLMHMMEMLRSELDSYATSSSPPVPSRGIARGGGMAISPNAAAGVLGLGMAATNLEDATLDIMRDIDASSWQDFLTGMDDGDGDGGGVDLPGFGEVSFL